MNLHKTFKFGQKWSLKVLTDFYVRNRNCQNMFLKFIQKVFTVYVLYNALKVGTTAFRSYASASSMWKKVFKKIFFLLFFVWDFKGRIIFILESVNVDMITRAQSFTSLMADLHQDINWVFLHFSHSLKELLH